MFGWTSSCRCVGGALVVVVAVLVLGSLALATEVDLEQLANAARPTEITGPSVSFLGAHEDRVARYVNMPDGFLDGHFQVRAYFPGETELEALHLHLADADGEKLHAWWSSCDEQSMVLGVYHGQEMINPARDPSLGTVQGWVMLDLYAAGPTPFVQDNYYRLEMHTDAGVFTTLYQLDEIEVE